MFSWAPWVTQVRTFEALRRLGWQGDFIAWAHLEAEGELKRIKDPKLFVIGANALFDDALPEQKVIAEAAKKAGSKYPPEQMTEGWIAGMVIEAALKGAGAKATTESLRESMSNLKVDLQAACAAARSNGPRTTTSAPSNSIASTSGTRRRPRSRSRRIGTATT